MKLLVFISLISSIASSFSPSFGNAVKQFGFSDPVPSGTRIIEIDEGIEIWSPSARDPTIQLHSPKLPLTSVPLQWIAWYFKSCLTSDISANGFSSFSSDFIVPPLPKAGSNLAIFNGLQPVADGSSYNFILQPVLMHGTWMAGSISGWSLTSVMCPAQGSCQFTSPVSTKPGNKIRGVITQLKNSSPYQYEVNITDLTASSKTQTLLYSSKYFAQWAYVSLEHNPAGNLGSCNELPSSTSLDFTNNVLKPTSIDNWEGAQNDMSCGLTVDTFVFSDASLSIKL